MRPEPGAVPDPAPVLAAPPAAVAVAELPEYLEKTYWWAYLRRPSIWIFDHNLTVSAILWGQYRKLVRAALDEVKPGEHVLQMACVYGDLSRCIARKVGPDGRLDIIDVASIQVENARGHLAPFPWARASIANAATPGPEKYDVVLCYFLLHEMPDDQKQRVVDTALERLNPEGRAVFIDFHRPSRWHPLRPVQALVFALLEPFAARLWRIQIPELSSQPRRFLWSKNTMFGGFFQKLVATPAVALQERRLCNVHVSNQPGQWRSGA